MVFVGAADSQARDGLSRSLTASFPAGFLFADPADFDPAGDCLSPVPLGVLGVLAVHSFMARQVAKSAKIRRQHDMFNAVLDRWR